MNKEEYQISFNVPAFLGDAEQKSVWRTPPFKALIQHWWRVVVAKEHDYDCPKVRESEGRLFGHAWLKDNSGKEWAMRSRVRIKLEQFKPGFGKRQMANGNSMKRRLVILKLDLWEAIFTLASGRCCIPKKTNTLN